MHGVTGSFIFIFRLHVSQQTLTKIGAHFGAKNSICVNEFIVLDCLKNSKRNGMVIYVN